MIYTLVGEVSKILLALFSLEKIINAKRKNVFDIFSNYEQYEKLIPKYFPSIRIRSVRGETAVVEEHFKLGDLELILMSNMFPNPMFCMRYMLLVENLRAAIFDKNLSKFLKVQKSLLMWI